MRKPFEAPVLRPEARLSTLTQLQPAPSIGG